MEPRPLVLFADDDADTREMYQLGLGLCGCTVEVACDGVEAWEKAQVLLPDVVVTDIMLPRLDGVALCHRIREEPRTAHIPVIAVTGWAGKSVDAAVREAGFRASLLKPVLPDVLVAEIRKVVGQSRSLRGRSEDQRSRASRLVVQSDRLLARSETLRNRVKKPNEP